MFGAAALYCMAFALSCDAFAVSVARGMTSQRPAVLDVPATAAAFGAAQALMPALGFWGGCRLAGGMLQWGGRMLAALVLLMLGIKTICAALVESTPETITPRDGYLRTLAAQALATSIDALAAGIGLAGLGAEIMGACTVIGCVTAAVCAAGYLLGKWLGGFGCRGAQLAGGAILLGLAAKTALLG